ncbi:MAG: methyltransferase domain-containing protein [Novipirellula sp. JB048]
MIAVHGIQKSTIRAHYQLGTLFYRLLWGRHIHHGLWYGDESPTQAQRQLTDTLAEMGAITDSDAIVDIGCGMGAASIQLAQHRHCHVTGVTLSPLQRAWASLAARCHRVAKQTRFLTGDAESIEFAERSFDVVWSVECTEHLFDKAGFFRRAAGWLRPGGRMAICAWCEGEDSTRRGHREQVEEVCRRFICPSLATRQDYATWMQAAGLTVRHNLDWTARTAKTWEICKRRVARSGVRHLAKLLDRDQVAFIDGFDTLLNAYRSGAMQYGAITAEKPASC